MSADVTQPFRYFALMIMSENVSRASELQVCYMTPKSALVDQALVDKIANTESRSLVKEFIVPKRSGQAWQMNRGEVCRITVVQGSQVADVNMWNVRDTKERFYSGKTRQLHASHLTTYDRLWSSMPYLRPMATITADTIKYGIDDDGAGVHDVIGTRCDPYTYKLITGKTCEHSCHTNLVQAVQPHGLVENDVQDVFNVFMCTGFTKDSHQYFSKASPAKTGDYIEFIADMDLLVAMSVCPHGDVSTPVGRPVPDENCHPLGVSIYKLDQSLANQWLGNQS